MQVIGPELSWKEVFLTWDNHITNHTLLVSHLKNQNMLCGINLQNPPHALWRTPFPLFSVQQCSTAVHTAGFKSILSAMKEQHNTRLFPVVHMWLHDGKILTLAAAHLLLKCLLAAACLFLLHFQTVSQETDKVGCSMWAPSGQARTWDIPWTQTGIWLFVDSCSKNPSPDRMKRNKPSLKRFTQNTWETHFKPQDNIHNINRED